MKKVVFLTIVILMLLALIACGNETKKPTAEKLSTTSVSTTIETLNKDVKLFSYKLKSKYNSKGEVENEIKALRKAYFDYCEKIKRTPKWLVDKASEIYYSYQ